MEALQQRLLSQIEIVPGPLQTDCWLFRTSKGHPNLRWQGQVSRASRFSYLAFVGAITADHYVCHKCDVPICIDPKHLFQGTPQDNVQDAIAKGRFWASRAEANQPFNEEETVMNDKVVNLGAYKWEREPYAYRCADLYFAMQHYKKKMRLQFLEDIARMKAEGADTEE